MHIHVHVPAVQKVVVSFLLNSNTMYTLLPAAILAMHVHIAETVCLSVTSFHKAAPDPSVQRCALQLLYTYNAYTIALILQVVSTICGQFTVHLMALLAMSQLW
jgi:hypothetical protein